MTNYTTPILLADDTNILLDGLDLNKHNLLQMENCQIYQTGWGS